MGAGQKAMSNAGLVYVKAHDLAAAVDASSPGLDGPGRFYGGEGLAVIKETVHMAVIIFTCPDYQVEGILSIKDGTGSLRVVDGGVDPVSQHKAMHRPWRSHVVSYDITGIINSQGIDILAPPRDYRRIGPSG